MTKKKGSEKKSRSSTNEEEICRLTEIAKETPDMRQERIDEIKKQIESGTYNVPAEFVAESIIAHYKEFILKKSPKKDKQNR